MFPKITERMQRCIVGECEHEVVVTYLKNKGWGVRILLNGEVNQGTIVADRSMIGVAARSMLRMEDKCGNISDLAQAARTRGFRD